VPAPSARERHWLFAPLKLHDKTALIDPLLRTSVPADHIGPGEAVSAGTKPSTSVLIRERRRGETPRSRPARMRSLECDHVAGVPALARRAAGGADHRKAINGGYDLLEAKCNLCDRVSLVPLRALKHPPETPVWKLEAALYCEPCSEGRHGITAAASAMLARKASRKP
jgi:hypothetical protein